MMEDGAFLTTSLKDTGATIVASTQHNTIDESIVLLGLLIQHLVKLLSVLLCLVLSCLVLSRLALCSCLVFVLSSHSLLVRLFPF